MNIQRMHSEIKLRYNKLNSNHKPDFPSAFIDDFINNAQDEFVHICYSGNNYKRFKLGFEITQQRIDMLSTLVPPEETVAVTLFKPNIYKVDLSTLSKPYRHHIRLFATTSCGKIECEAVRHNDLDHYLRSENTKPSAVWRRCIFVESSDGNGNQCLYLHTGGQFTITNVTISYIKEPRKVYYGGYDTLEYTLGDTTSPNTGDAAISSELPTVSHSILVEIAVQLMERALHDTEGIQISEDKINRII